MSLVLSYLILSHLISSQHGANIDNDKTHYTYKHYKQNYFDDVHNYDRYIDSLMAVYSNQIIKPYRFCKLSLQYNKPIDFYH
jgi:hypothetical protein